MKISRMFAMCCALALALRAVPAVADSGPWYLGAGVGETSYGVPDSSSVTVPATVEHPSFQLNSTNKQDATAYRLDGGYRFGDYVALEGLYADFGSVTSDISVTSPAFSGAGHLQTKVWGADAVVRLPLRGGFDLFARAGWVRYHTDDAALQVRTVLAPVGPPTITSFTVFERSSSGTTAVLGAGADYDLTADWSVRAAFEYFQGNTGSSYVPGIHVLSLEALYRF